MKQLAMRESTADEYDVVSYHKNNVIDIDAESDCSITTIAKASLSSDAPTTECTDSDVKCNLDNDSNSSTEASLHFDFISIAQQPQKNIVSHDSGDSSHCQTDNNNYNFYQMDVKNRYDELFICEPFIKKTYHTSDSDSEDNEFKVSNYNAARVARVTQQLSNRAVGVLTHKDKNKKPKKRQRKKKRPNNKKYRRNKGKREVDDDSSDTQSSDESSSDSKTSAPAANAKVECFQGKIYKQCTVSKKNDILGSNEKVYYDIWKIKLIIGILSTFGSNQNPRNLVLIWYFNSLLFNNKKKGIFQKDLSYKTEYILWVKYKTNITLHLTNHKILASMLLSTLHGFCANTKKRLDSAVSTLESDINNADNVVGTNCLDESVFSRFKFISKAIGYASGQHTRRGLSKCFINESITWIKELKTKDPVNYEIAKEALLNYKSQAEWHHYHQQLDSQLQETATAIEQKEKETAQRKQDQKQQLARKTVTKIANIIDNESEIEIIDNTLEQLRVRKQCFPEKYKWIRYGETIENKYKTKSNSELKTILKECLRIEQNPKCIKIVDIFDSIKSDAEKGTSDDNGNANSNESSIKYRLRSNKTKKNTKNDNDSNENTNTTCTNENTSKYCYCWDYYNSQHEMIACDACNEWYHVFKCLFMSNSEYEKYKGRKKYECPDCQYKRRSINDGIRK